MEYNDQVPDEVLRVFIEAVVLPKIRNVEEQVRKTVAESKSHKKKRFYGRELAYRLICHVNNSVTDPFGPVDSYFRPVKTPAYNVRAIDIELWRLPQPDNYSARVYYCIEEFRCRGST